MRCKQCCESRSTTIRRPSRSSSKGRLAGPWLRELEECWKSTLAQQRKSILRVDLTGVTFIDDAGKTCLAAMYRQGAELSPPTA